MKKEEETKKDKDDIEIISSKPLDINKNGEEFIEITQAETEAVF